MSAQYLNALPFPIDRVETDDNVAQSLGQLYAKKDDSLGWQVFRLVKAASAITTPNKTFLAYSDRSAYEVDAKAAGENRHEVAGLVSNDITSIASGDYFFIQVAGIGTAIAGTASLAANVALLSYTGGKVDDASAAFDDCIAFSNEAQASADSDVEVTLNILI